MGPDDREHAYHVLADGRALVRGFQALMGGDAPLCGAVRDLAASLRGLEVVLRSAGWVRERWAESTPHGGDRPSPTELDRLARTTQAAIGAALGDATSSSALQAMQLVDGQLARCRTRFVVLLT